MVRFDDDGDDTGSRLVRGRKRSERGRGAGGGGGGIDGGWKGGRLTRVARGRSATDDIQQGIGGRFARVRALRSCSGAVA